MKKLMATLFALFAFVSVANADSVLIIDAGYSTVTANVKGRIEAAGHTTTVTTDVSLIPTATSTYQQVWDLRYSAALTAGEQTNYQAFITNGGFAYFVTENPGCCMNRNNSVAALITALGGGTTTIGANFNTAADVESNVNTKYMTSGITVNYAAVSAIINSQGIPLIQDGTGDVSGMSWIGRAGNLGQGVTGTIVTVADTNWLDNVRFSTAQGATVAQQQNVTALDDIIRGIVAGTVAGTISANGNGAGSQQQNQAPTVVSTAPGTPKVTSSAANGTAVVSSTSSRGTTASVSNATTGVTTYAASARDAAVKNATTINVTRTTTVVGTTPRTTVTTATTPITTVTTTTTPRTTTTVTTPVTVTTYSDGSTVSTDGTPVTTTSTTNVVTTTTTTTNEVITTTVRDNIVQSASSDQSQAVSATAARDAIRARNMNPFLVDPLSTQDGVWAAPFYRSTRSGGNVTAQGASAGWQSTVDNNSFGFALSGDRGSVNGLAGSTSNIESYSGTVYVLIRDDMLWYKASAGYGRSTYLTKTEIPTFALVNNSTIRQNNIYGDFGIYTANTFEGIRPLAGVIINRSEISGVESGSLLLSTLPPNGAETKVMPYIGTRYEFSKELAFEFRAIQTPDYKTVLSNRGVVSGNITEDISVNATIGFDKSIKEKYNNFYGMIGMKFSF